MSTHQYALGVVGTGHIATVMLGRLIDSGYLNADRIIASDSRTLRRHSLEVAVAKDNGEVVRGARIILIAVRPQQFAEAAASIRGETQGDHLFVSMMAGMMTAHIAAALGDGPVRVIRAMPNLPFGLGCGVTGVFRGSGASLDDLEEARHLLNAGGATVVLDDEGLMDAVTAVAGSGPAYFYYFVEMLMEAGVKAGLKRADAQVLAAHACVGAGAMLLDKDASPRELREAVCSAGGTTEAAMKVLTECDVAANVGEAVLAAFRRGQELGRLNSAG